MLIEGWKRAHRFHTVKLALLWGAVAGLVAVWSAFENVIPLWLYAGLSVAMNGSIAVARVLKQPGVE